MKIFFQTLGCKVNQYETQALERLFKARGWDVANGPSGCDVCVINTCAVTAESERKSRQAVRRVKQQAPGAVIAVCGCSSQLSPKAHGEIGADVVFGSGDRNGFVDAVISAYTSGKKAVNVDEPLKRRRFELLPSGGLEGRTRAMLKIQDGCSNFCTYCVIPYTRGPSRSLPLERLASEAGRLKEEGFCEIVITGIEIASYGKDLEGKPGLSAAVAAISSGAPGVRLRLGSLEPRVITGDFCEKISALGSVCPHFHLSLQSGCDETLSRMGRKYDTERFYESVKLLREYFPGCGIAADLITGFPGETEEEFEKTLAFIEKCAFSSMHIFPYSVRPGTRAALMDGQVEKRVKAQRAECASAIADRMEKRFLESLTGTVQSVLFETESGGFSTGHAGNYCKVRVQAAGLRKTVKDVRIISAKEDILLGNILL